MRAWAQANGVEVSARPSDAIALALRTGTPIFGSETVLDDAGIAVQDIGIRRPTLDDAFLSLTGHRAEDATDDAEAGADQQQERAEHHDAALAAQVEGGAEQHVVPDFVA